jgi:hypothetical protein
MNSRLKAELSLRDQTHTRLVIIPPKAFRTFLVSYGGGLLREHGRYSDPSEPSSEEWKLSSGVVTIPTNPKHLDYGLRFREALKTCASLLAMTDVDVLVKVIEHKEEEIFRGK